MSCLKAHMVSGKLVDRLTKLSKTRIELQETAETLTTIARTKRLLMLMG
jgi:hypothetical protein